MKNQPNSVSRNSLVSVDPAAEPPSNIDKPGSEKKILAYGVKWTNDTPHVKVKRAPVNNLPVNVKRKMENQAHKQIKDWVKGKGGDK